MKFLSVFLSCLSFSVAIFADSPPRHVPPELYEEFTMEGRVPVIEWYLYEPGSVDHPTVFRQSLINEYIQVVQRKGHGYYGVNLDRWLYQALERYPIAGKEVGIIGSTLPFYESVVLAYGGKPITVEYNKIVSEDPRITTYTVDEFNENPRKFDVILSISSIEHDGLGRYGDPINPNADLEFMTKAKSLLKEGGHMILAVPVGRDVLIWTACRVYGSIRLPLLLKEWNLIDSFGFSEKDFTSGALGNYVHQPIFYLEPK
ncbi:MAG: DUF268 domain-containing protein [Rhabdochlamydiaceae bacterium]|nr:DUF268 domain-containing protein [Rhabdochlamydiaceae bacterium]